MTTIAFKNFRLAGDSKVTRGGIHIENADKVFIKNKITFAVHGDVTAALYVAKLLGELNCFEHLQKLEIGIETSSDWHVAFIYGGKLWEISSHDKIIVQLDSKIFYAWGSGGDIALGAMAAEKSAAEAVEIASRFDVNTGGKIISMGIIYT